MTPRNPRNPPSDLDSQSRELWRRTIAQLTAQGTWADSDAPCLERYVRSIELGRIARARIAARVEVEGDAAYTTRGSQGQLVAHPDLKTAREAERDANDYATDLLLTPRTRSQHSIKPPRSGRSQLEMILGGADKPQDGASARGEGSGRRAAGSRSKAVHKRRGHVDSDGDAA